MHIPDSTRAWFTAGVVTLTFFVGACGDDGASQGTATTAAEPATDTAADSTTTTRETPTTSEPDQTVHEIEVRGGSVVGGVERLSVRLGETVTIRVRSDVADEMHLHGYDLSQPVGPGAPAELTFTADIPGVFELELEERGLPIAELEIS